MTNALHDSIVALESILDERDGLPAWHTPRASLWDDDQRAVYPYGNLNCGLAHGIPGPLAVLSLGLRAGLSTPGLPRAITKIVDWLYDNRSDDDWGVNWPTAVAIAQPPASLILA